MGNVIGQIIFGLVIGIIAKFLMPGRDPGGFIITALIGMAGALIGTFVGRAVWGGAGYEAGWIAAIFGAIILLAGYRLVTNRGGATST
ncbi:MAG: GlsB/YeaQ/YmgE family stress response membrane protein [Acidobacteria bacterium]|nr:GlsB/YeaQ/YmgE family stress response membrane protein [Acidobacteriota bacterium]